MRKTYVTITPAVNHIWAGRGTLVSIDVNTAIAIVTMFTGDMAGKVGGFDLTGLEFQTARRSSVLADTDISRG